MGVVRTWSSFIAVCLLAQLGWCQLYQPPKGPVSDKGLLLQSVPKLSSRIEKELQDCIKIIRGRPEEGQDNAMWYKYFSCVEKELYKNKVVSGLKLLYAYFLQKKLFSSVLDFGLTLRYNFSFLVCRFPCTLSVL